jgi:shikimate kinase / 3-dehydroquinate synthase
MSVWDKTSPEAPGGAPFPFRTPQPGVRHQDLSRGAVSVLTRHVALIGFMGAGKSSLGQEVARRIGLPFRDVDSELERSFETSIASFFAAEGEEAFRVREAAATVQALRRTPPTVLALGGGAVTQEPVRAALREHAVTVLVDVDVETAWQRVEGTDRPLAQERATFFALYDQRTPLYREVADVRARDADDVVLAAAGVHVETGALPRLASLVPGDGPVALVSDPHVAGIHGMDAQLALGQRLAERHELPAGEEAKTLATLDRLWQDLRLDRRGTIVAFGGGCTTDAAGFAAATYLRGVPWAPVPTSLVAQVDAAIGGKTAIDLPQGKNLVGAFHWPLRTVVDPALLQTLPEAQRREGLAEVVKTGLLAGAALWELPDAELVRRCAAFKAAVCLRDPHDRGERAILNLGHTFAHALETGARYGTVTHGQAVALGLTAALRLSGRDVAPVEEVLRPKPVRVDRELAWQAMQRDKKAVGGELRLVLLGDDGPRWDVAVAPEQARRELDRLIAG